jgi:hypothetical protein
MKKRSFQFSPALAMEAEARAYRDTVIDRFRNPFLDHLLAEIFINHEAKKQRRFGGLIGLAGVDPNWMNGHPTKQRSEPPESNAGREHPALTRRKKHEETCYRYRASITRRLQRA